MALFGSKKKAATKKDETSKAGSAPLKKAAKADAAVPAKKSASRQVTTVSAPVQGAPRGAGAIIRPRITEKSGILSQSGTYTFEISEGANKHAVAVAIRSIYKVDPIKVSIINTPSRDVFIRGRKGTVSGIRKAMVTLKKGDKIDFV